MSEPQDLPLRGPPAVSSQCSSNSLVPLHKYPARSCQLSDQNPASVWVRPQIYTSPTLAGPSITSLTLSVWLSLNRPSTLTPPLPGLRPPNWGICTVPRVLLPTSAEMSASQGEGLPGLFSWQMQPALHSSLLSLFYFSPADIPATLLILK